MIDLQRFGTLLGKLAGMVNILSASFIGHPVHNGRKAFCLSQ